MVSEPRPVEDLVEDVIASIDVGSIPLIWGGAGLGKCLGRGTPVLMYDGTVKAVEDVVVGDRLMGPDSAARTVMSLARGREMLYRVTPKKGDSYVVNESHILSLKMTPPSVGQTHRVVNVSVRDYLGKSREFKNHAKGWRVGVDWSAAPVDVDPYILGTWLADGTLAEPRITTADREVVQAWREYAVDNSMTLRTAGVSGRSATYAVTTGRRTGQLRTRNVLKQALRTYGLLSNEKFIPQVYKANSRSVRLALLAGIIDGDGYLTGGCYDVVFKGQRLADDLCFLVRSLGMAAYRKPCVKVCTNNGKAGDYHRVTISGDIATIPCRVSRRVAAARQQIKNVLVTGITVEAIGEGDYFGFEIDGDRLFLLGDFTVTHNTAVVNAIARRKKLPMYTLIGSLCDPTDINGFPVVAQTRVWDGTLDQDGEKRTHPVLEFAPRRWLVELNRAGGIIFFDELTSSPPAVQAALLRSMLDKVFGDFPLDPTRVAMIAAANPPDIAVNGQELGAPMINRLDHYTFPTGDGASQEWAAEFTSYWGNPPVVKFGDKTVSESSMLRARSFVAGFVRRFPDLWHKMPGERDNPDKAKKGAKEKTATQTDDGMSGWPSPRSWDRASRHVGRCIDAGADPIESIRRVEAAVGAGAATQFVAYMREVSIPDPEALLADPDSYAPFGRPDLDFAVLAAVAASVEAEPNAKRFKAAWTILGSAFSGKNRTGHVAYEAGAPAGRRLAAFLRPEEQKKIRVGLGDREVPAFFLEIRNLAKPFDVLLKHMGVNL